MQQISVVIPFKGQQAVLQLEGCLRSLFFQKVKPFEIILVGSENDLQKSTARKFLQRKNVKFFDFVGDKNEARNIGISNARGDYILYLDHDMVANDKLIENCLSKAKQCDAIIIPEKGAGGGFWENCKKLEKELITYDIHTVTPRFYKRGIFKKGEKPFDSNFGLLDEWGFSNKLMKKKVRLGYSNSFILVKDSNFSIVNEIKNKFSRGLWMKNFYHKDKNDAWKRINPIQRGIIFYSGKLHYFIKEPKYFLGLVVLKTLDFVSFMTGYLVGYFLNLEKDSQYLDLIQHYDKLKGGYLNQMYTKNFWTAYVDFKEKEAVLRILISQNKKNKNQKILDLGMGPGRWVKFFLKNQLGRVYGVDISSQMVEYAKKNIINNKFESFVAEMSNLPFRDENFDVVFCFRALKYADNTEVVIKEVGRVLKNKGIFILEVSNNSLTNRLLKLIANVFVILGKHSSYSSKWGYFYKAKFYTRNTIAKVLLKQQFKILTISPLFILPSVPLPTMKGRLIGFWQILDRLLFLILPEKWFCRSWLLVATKKD